MRKVHKTSISTIKKKLLYMYMYIVYLGRMENQDGVARKRFTFYIHRKVIYYNVIEVLLDYFLCKFLFIIISSIYNVRRKKRCFLFFLFFFFVDKNCYFLKSPRVHKEVDALCCFKIIASTGHLALTVSDVNYLQICI